MARAEKETALTRTIDAYIAGRKGVDFDALSVFAEPLFELYDLDLRNLSPAGPLQYDTEELSGLVAVLDTARLFWAFFSQDGEASERHAQLEDALIGPSPSDDERSDFIELVSIMEEQWHALSPAEREAATEAGDPMPPFEQLLSEYVSSGVDDAMAAFSGDDMDLPEAMALFAQPLTDNAVADPDAIEDALVRAQAYWDIAHAPEVERPALLEEFKQSVARSKKEGERIENEARMMLERFSDLFPDRSL
jgi:hypothetical protein